PVALQSPEADALLAGMSEEARMASWHLVSPDGEVRSAGAALAPLMRMLPGGAPIAFVAEALPGVTARAYDLVARSRGAIGRLIPEGAKARADSVLERRASRDRTADR